MIDDRGLNLGSKTKRSLLAGIGFGRLSVPKTPSNLKTQKLTTIRETIALPISISLFVALLALIASGFRTRAALQAKKALRRSAIRKLVDQPRCEVSIGLL